MTIELSIDDLTQLAEAAARYGACVFKTRTTDGEEVWIAAQNNHRPGRKRAAAEREAPRRGGNHPVSNSGNRAEADAGAALEEAK